MFQTFISFFVQAEDCIRDGRVTGVQTCALPISGVAARDLSECLLILLRQLGLTDDSLPSRIVRYYLPMLESRRFDRLARELAVPIEQIAEADRKSVV